jgi:hypothetical protein
VVDIDNGVQRSLGELKLGAKYSNFVGGEQPLEAAGVGYDADAVVGVNDAAAAAVVAVEVVAAHIVGSILVPRT